MWVNFYILVYPSVGPTFCNYHKLFISNKSSLTSLKIIKRFFFLSTREDQHSADSDPRTPGFRAGSGLTMWGLGGRGLDLPELLLEPLWPSPTAALASTQDRCPSSRLSRPHRAGPPRAQVLGTGHEGKVPFPGPEPPGGHGRPAGPLGHTEAPPDPPR